MGLTPQAASNKIVQILEELRLEMMRRWCEALPLFSRASSFSTDHTHRSHRNISKLSRREQLLYYFHKRRGFWTRGHQIYKARKSGTTGLAMLVEIDDPTNVLFVLLETLVSRWTYLEEYPK